jgi:hypothetical protein
MTPETDKVQFSRQIWQAASEHALQCLERREFCPDRSRIENLRCEYLVEETDTAFGSQIWCFEAIGIDRSGRRQILHGVLEFSIQYGLMEPSQTGMFDDMKDRENFLKQEKTSRSEYAYSYVSTRFWVASAWLGVACFSLIWILALVNSLYTRAR